PFGLSLDQPRLARSSLRCLRVFKCLTIPSDSSAETRIEAPRSATLSGRLQTLDSGLDRPSNACSPRPPAAKSSAESRTNHAQQWLMRLHVATNEKDHRPRANDAPIGTEALSPGSVHPLGSAWLVTEIVHRGVEVTKTLPSHDGF